MGEGRGEGQWYWVFLLFFIFIISPISASALTRQLPLSGQLLTPGKIAVPDGDYTMRFSIYTADRTASDPYPSDADSSTRIWTETQTVKVERGLWKVILGSTTALPDTLNFETGNYFLGIRINTDSEMVPRKKILPVPQALNSESVGGVKPGTGNNNILQLDSSGAVNIAGNITTAGILQGANLIVGTSIQLPAGSILTGDILDGTISTLDLADGIITTVKIADNSVSSAKLQDGSVTANKILDGAVTTSKIADGAITNAKITNDAIGSNHIIDGAVTVSKIADGAITAVKLFDGSVTTAKINDLSVTAAKITDGAITTVKISDGSVATSKINDLAVTTLKIADGAITTVKLSDGSISTAKLSDLSVTTAKVADLSITAAKLATGDLHFQNTDTGTTSLVFGLGTGTAIGTNNFSLTASNAANKPAVRYNGTSGKWQISNDGTIFADIGSSLSSSLQAAYDSGNSITTTDNRNILFNLADTATDSSFLINIQGTGNSFQIQDAGTPIFTVADGGLSTFGGNINLSGNRIVSTSRIDGYASNSFLYTTVDLRSVSANTALALDSSNYPHIAYYTNDSSAATIADWDGTQWTITDFDTAGAHGYNIDLVIDGADIKHAVYRNNVTDDSDLIYAKYVGTGGTGCASTAWSCTTVDSAGDVGINNSIDVDDRDLGNIIPHISYYDATNGDLKHAKYVGSGGTGCASAAWSCEIVESTNTIGGASSIAVNRTNGDIHIIYYDTTNDDLRYVKYSGGSWGAPVNLDGRAGCIAAGCGTRVVGNYSYGSNLVLNTSGNPRVAYFDDTGNNLYYAYSNDGGATWTTSVIEGGAGATGTGCAASGDYGQYPSLTLDSGGNPHISYYNYSAYDLRYASNNGSAWTCQTLDSASTVGLYTSIKMTSADKVYISYQYSTNNDLKIVSNNYPKLNIYSDVSIMGETGNLGIGVLQPTERLDVAGNIKASGSITSSITVSGNALIASTYATTPAIYGGTGSSASLTLDSTSSSIKGDVYINPGGKMTVIGNSVASARLATAGLQITPNYLYAQYRYYDSGTGYTYSSNRVVEANSYGGTPFTLVSAAGDMAYFGSYQPFNSLDIDLATSGILGVGTTVSWETSGGAAINGISDGTSNFTQDGVVTWTDTLSSTTVNSIPAYWIRANVTTTAYTTAPTANSTIIGRFGTAAAPLVASLIQPAGIADSTTWSATGTMLGINTPSSFNGNFVDLQINGASQFKVTSGGTILASGTTGTTPISGAGTRLMWIPAKGALMAGQVSGVQWDDANIGANSVAFGIDNTASGITSTAFGSNNIASGTISATAFGRLNTASGSYSTAFGYTNTASGNYSTAFGDGNSASNSYSTAFGILNAASGIGATVFGENNTASGTNATAFGINNAASGADSAAFGYSSTSSGNYSISAGQYLTGSATNTLVLGKGVSNGSRLTNSIQGSLMFGYNLTTPTLYARGGGTFTASAVSTTSGLAAVTGSGTSFTTQLIIGDRITIGAETKTVTAIASNTSLTADSNFSTTNSGVSMTILPALLAVRDRNNTPALFISDAKNIGINTATPSGNLDIRQIADGNQVIYARRNTDTTPTGNFLQFQDAAGNATLFSVDITGALTASGNATLGANITNGTTTIDLGGTGTANAVCHTTQTGTDNEGLVDCTSAPAADYAEMYPVASGVDYGDIVAVGAKMLKTKDGDNIVQLVKSSTPYQSTTIGIVSNNYGDFTSAGYNIKKEDNPKPIALNGRVPVKVSLENGPIAAGDPLTSSSIPGVAMKATGTGYVIGKALENFAPSPQPSPTRGEGGSASITSPFTGEGEGEGKILVFVNPGWYSPPIGPLVQGGNNQSDEINIGNLATTKDLIVTGLARIKGDLIVEGKIRGDLEVEGIVKAKGIVGGWRSYENHFLSSKFENDFSASLRAAGESAASWEYHKIKLATDSLAGSKATLDHSFNFKPADDENGATWRFMVKVAEQYRTDAQNNTEQIGEFRAGLYADEQNYALIQNGAEPQTLKFITCAVGECTTTDNIPVDSAAANRNYVVMIRSGESKLLIDGQEYAKHTTNVPADSVLHFYENVMTSTDAAQSIMLDYLGVIAGRYEAF